jgi:homoserine kinase type II
MAMTGDELLLAEVCAAAGLGELRDVRYLPIGLMNRNWHAETASGSFAIKQLMDINAEQAGTQLALLGKLAARGLPVPVPHSSGVQTLGDKSFTIFPWVRGKHLSGPEMSLAQCVELGTLLSEVHEALASLLPSPGEATLMNQDPADTLRYIEKLQRLIDARPEPDDMDAIARANLTWRQHLVPEISHLRPQGTVLGPPGWTHGDFHHNNVLWHNGSVTAIVDWDRVKVQPLGAEVVRMCLLTFVNDDGSLDLAHISAFVSAYRPKEPLAEALHRMWWFWLNGFWPLDWRYERGDTSCDHLFVRNERMLRWWTAHRAEVAGAFAG